MWYSVESIWIELVHNHKSFLYGLLNRPPNVNGQYFLNIEDSVALAIDTGISDVIVTGDFNFNFQGQLLEGVECHIYLYCFTFDDINLNRVLSLLSYFQKNIAIRKCVQIK